MLIHPWGALISESNQSVNHPGFLNGRSDESIDFMITMRGSRLAGLSIQVQNYKI